MALTVAQARARLTIDLPDSELTSLLSAIAYEIAQYEGDPETG